MVKGKMTISFLLGCKLRNARRTDLLNILKIEKTQIKPIITRYYKWNGKVIKKIILENLKRTHVLTLNRKIIGFYYWVQDKDTAFLYSIEIEPEWRNIGLGEKLMKSFEREAKETGFNSCKLSVFKDAEALHFYRKL